MSINDIIQFFHEKTITFYQHSSDNIYQRKKIKGNFGKDCDLNLKGKNCNDYYHLSPLNYNLTQI